MKILLFIQYIIFSHMDQCLTFGDNILSAFFAAFSTFCVRMSVILEGSLKVTVCGVS